MPALDAEDETIEHIVGSGVMGSGAVHDHLARSVTRALPGNEQPIGRLGDGGMIAFDLLIGILTAWFREHLPAGWMIHGSGRSGGFRLRVPDSPSEQHFTIDVSWIVTSDLPGRQHLLQVTHAALASLQTAVATTTSSPWPGQAPDEELPEPHPEITGDTINPTLRLWYGPSNSPALELAPRPLLNMILYDRG